MQFLTERWSIILFLGMFIYYFVLHVVNVRNPVDLGKIKCLLVCIKILLTVKLWRQFITDWSCCLLVNARIRFVWTFVLLISELLFIIYLFIYYTVYTHVKSLTIVHPLRTYFSIHPWYSMCLCFFAHACYVGRWGHAFCSCFFFVCLFKCAFFLTVARHWQLCGRQGTNTSQPHATSSCKEQCVWSQLVMILLSMFFENSIAFMDNYVIKKIIIIDEDVIFLILIFTLIIQFFI